MSLRSFPPIISTAITYNQHIYIPKTLHAHSWSSFEHHSFNMELVCWLVCTYSYDVFEDLENFDSISTIFCFIYLPALRTCELAQCVCCWGCKDSVRLIQCFPWGITMTLYYRFFVPFPVLMDVCVCRTWKIHMGCCHIYAHLQGKEKLRNREVGINFFVDNST